MNKNTNNAGDQAADATKFVTSTVGNTVGGLLGTVGNVTGAATKGVGDTISSATGETGRPVGDGLTSVGTGIGGGVSSVGKGVENAGQWKKHCKLCFKNHLLWTFPDDGALTITRGGEDTLVKYNSAALEEEFCSHCGICVNGTHMAGPSKDKKAINVRTLLDVNPFNLDIKYDGETEEDPAYSFPKFDGPLPDYAGDNLKLYTGSCYCGAVRIAVKSPPVTSVEVKEDNCSICVRTGSIQIYPHTSQVSILGKENTKDYVFGRKFNGTPFCKTCGGHIFGILYGPPQAVVDRLPAARKEFVKKQLEVQPVNLRVLDGVEWSDLNITRSDEGTEGYVLEY